MRTVVLFSGGLDSTTVLAMVIARGDEAFPLTVAYGQRHRVETEKARRILDRYGLAARVREVTVDLSFLSSSSLINTDLAVPGSADTAIPNTYVPARNLVFLSLASAYAEDIGATRIAIGVNALDYSGYPDCRPEFIEAFNRVLATGTKAGVAGGGIIVEAPLIDLSKKEIVQLGRGLGVDHAMTHSCYDPDPEGRACGACDSCRLRLKGFAEAGITDPAPYQPG
ncbi:MAG TPA: 7-cyano-7-deazaguanine synthase QueC [bacterium]|nr:7-cyano-7-deazaguanine synthase QueC [bacterium]